MRNNQQVVITPKQNETIQKALALHQGGKLDQAEQLYKKLLISLPAHPLILANLGAIALQKGQFKDAVRVIDRSLVIAPNQPNALNNRGNALQHLNRLEAAVASYDKAVTINPNFVEAYYNRGNVLHDLKNFEAAVASYDRVIALNANHAEAHYNRGIALQDLNRLAEAVASYDRVIALNADHAEACYNRGLALQGLNLLAEAVASYDRVIAIDPQHAEAYYNRGNSLKGLGRLAEAVASYDRAIAVNPRYAEAYSNRGIALKDLNRPEEAAASYEQALVINPHYAEAYSNYGNTLKDLNRPEEAVASYELALAINPGLAEAYYNRGIAQQELGLLAEAGASYDRATALNPGYAEAYWNKALLKLLMGDYVEGWALYEWGWAKGLRQPARTFPSRLWLGEAALAGKALLIYPEQGLGDYLQCLRYVALAEARGANVVLEAPPALMAVAAALKGQFTLIESGGSLPETDFHCPAMSLPLAFKTTVDSIPQQIPYLQADPCKLQGWRQRLGAKTKPRIGLAWSGSISHKNDHNRSIPLRTLAPLLELPLEFHCLQKEIRPDDAAFLAAAGQLAVHQAALADFSDTAALIQAMDLIITVDTSVAHLAGALGQATWVLLPYAPDFRWLLGRDDSPWYPAARLFRQARMGDWDGVVGKIKDALLIYC